MQKQPRIKLPKSGFAKFLDFLTIMLFLAVLIYLIIEFPGLPDRVPGHYDASGTVDRWGSKMELLILPIVAIGLWIMMTAVEKFPHTFNYMNMREDNIEAQYRNGQLMINVLKNESVLLFAYLIFQGIRVAAGEAEGLSNFFMPIFLVVIFGSMIIFMVRMFRL
ncbi:DUF1648 domain-containing protein [Planococcus beigongshangi]|uniref:DUF1648 domain-containing protein n=1 Tax=Planococcus beigongshangi TaxID=2782536 RepID=UPI00193C4E25|nr:DUF1648 domain-containing protein [Planococcus beigongshangi]